MNRRGPQAFHGEQRHVTITTPEGVPLHLLQASVSDRASAFVYDMFLLALLPFGVLLVASLARGSQAFDYALSLLLVLFFLWRSFYFTLFEIRGQGRTPGKKRTGLRVIAAQGGPLNGYSIVVRNLMREVELFLPLAVLASSEIIPEKNVFLRMLAFAWVVILLIFPLFHKERRRLGDLIAGTVVVQMPRHVLERDLAEVRSRSGQKASPAEEVPARSQAEEGPRHVFDEKQLSVYGVYELQVLEEVLRKNSRDEEALALVAKKIEEKISWSRSTGDTDPITAAAPPKHFLRDFYSALRAHLESRMLVGKERRDKHDRT